MNRSLLIFIAAVFLLAGCNNNENDKPAAAPGTFGTTTHPAQLLGIDLVDIRASRNIGELLCQGWEMEDDLDAITDNNSSMGIYPFRCFYFSEDGTFIKNPRNAMEYGKWDYNDGTKTITLNYHQGGKDVYKIGAVKATALIVINSGIRSITTLKFISQGRRYKDKMLDPYYVANNEWRIPPKKAESDSLIRKRLQECLHFYILFYQDNLVRENKSISFYGFPTCLEWFSGGIGMVKENELADNWVACFYNREQVKKAYQMLAIVIRKKYKWPEKNVSWVKKNLAVLKQIYKEL